MEGEVVLWFQPTVNTMTASGPSAALVTSAAWHGLYQEASQHVSSSSLIAIISFISNF